MRTHPYPLDAATQFLVQVNSTERDWPDAELTLHELIDRQAVATPDAVALRLDGQDLSYQQLRELTTVLASQLTALGIGRGHTVALMIERSFELVIGMLAVLRSGAAYVPMDLSLPPQRLLAMLDECQPASILQKKGRLIEHGLSAFRILSIDVEELSQKRPAAQDVLLTPGRSNDMAYAIFTSGSTGLPKAAMNDHQGVVNRLLWMQEAYPLTPADVVLQKTPYSFDVSVWEFFWPLMVGARMVIAKPGGHMDPFYLQQLMAQEGVTVVHFVPTMLRLFMEAIGSSPPKSLRLIFCSGEALPLDLMRQTLSTWPGADLHNLYGPTECAVDVTHWDCRAHAESPLVLIGAPVANTRIYILDANFQPTPPGEVGEIFIAGVQVGRGYLNRLELTAERFLADPFMHLFPQGKGGRMYRTGDLGRWIAGQGIEYLGRLDFQVKIGGVRIELEEIEAALMSSGLLTDAVVITRQRGVNEPELVAGVVPGKAATRQSAQGQNEWLHQLRQHIAGKLPSIMLPASIHEVRQIPLTTSGKADRRQLATDIEAATRATRSLGQPTAGRWETDTQEALAAIWGAHLPTPPKDPDADFLTHGGTSMSALLISSAIRRRMGKEVQPALLLKHPQLRQLAQEVDRCPQATLKKEHTESSVVDPSMPMTQTALLTEHQKTLITASLLDDSGAAMLVHVPLVLAAAITPDALMRAFGALWQRHPMFRVSAHWDDGTVKATLMPTMPDGWWQHHGTIATPPQDLDWSDELLDAMHRPLAPQGAPTRIDAWTLPDGRLLAIWTTHHFAIDEASTDHCLRELDRLLQGDTLPPVVGSPFDFPTQEQQWIDHDGVRHLAQQLIKDLAGHRAPFSTNVTTGHEFAFELPEALQGHLRSACTRLGCTPFPLLLAAFGLALQQTFGEQFRRLLAPFSRRVLPELMEPAGYFLDVRFLEAGRRTGESREAHLARVKSEVLASMTPSFQPMDLISAEVAKVDPVAARALGAFAITWRHDPARELTLGGHEASLLRYPHRASKFGLTLHAAMIDGVIRCSIEAVKEAFDHHQVAPLSQAFVTHLQGLVDAEAPSFPNGANRARPDAWPVSPASDGASQPGPLNLASADALALAGIWRTWASSSSENPHPGSDFVKEGGTSLSAIRMSMQIRDQMGVAIQVGAFLAAPQFGALLQQIEHARIHSASSPSIEHLTLIGPAHAQHLLLLIPGHGGHAVGLVQLAQALLRQLGEGHAVAIVDLDPMLQAGHDTTPQIQQLVEKIVAQVSQMDPTRLMGMAGFSLGGQLAIQVAKRLSLPPKTPIYLLDTYQPQAIQPGLIRRLEAALVRRVLRLTQTPPPPAQGAAMEIEGEELDLVMTPASKARWRQLERELLMLDNSGSGLSVHLLQAGHSLWNTALLRRRSTNGLDSRAYAAMQVYRLPAHHLELPKAAAPLTAHTIAATLAA